MRLTAFTLAILLLGAVFGPTQARAAQAAGSPAADGYRAVYTDRELLDHDYIQQWWQHVNDLFHRTGTMFLSGKREVRVDVTFQGYEYTRALKAMQGFEARLSPDEAAAAFLDSLRPGAMTFNVSAYLESGRLGPKEGPLLQGIWLVSDGKRLPARRVRIVRRGKQGQSLVVDAEFPPIQAAREPWITLGFATGGPRPASGHVLFPVDLLRATPAPGSARGKSGRSLDSQEATTPLTPVAEAAPAEPAPKAYSRQELSDAQYIESWWRRTRESHSRSYGSLDWVGNQVLVDAAYESREFTRALCATEGYQKRQSDAEIEGSFRRRYQPKEVAFQVRFSNAIWPSRKLNLGQLADHLRVSFDGGPEAAPLRVDPKASAIVGAELQARIVFARPQVAPTRQVTLLLRDLPTRDAVVRLKFAPALFTDEASTADKDR